MEMVKGREELSCSNKGIMDGNLFVLLDIMMENMDICKCSIYLERGKGGGKLDIRTQEFFFVKLIYCWEY